MKINVNKKSGVLLGLAVVLMLAALVIGCKTNVSTPETFAVTFSAEEHGTLKAKADGVTETNKSPISVEKDKTVVFTAVPEKGYEVEKWTVNGTAVANNVSTTYSHKVTAAVTVKVSFKALPPSAVAVTGVTLDKPTVSLVAGTSTTLTATVLPANATNKTVAWSSDKPAIASVDKNGTVTAHKAGEAIIIVTTEDGGKTASCKVNVTAKPPTTYKITFSVEGGNGTLKAKAEGIAETTISPINVEHDKTVTFTATADSGYRVKGWTRDGEAVNGTNDSYSFTVTKGIEVKVSFESNSTPPTPPAGDFVTITPPAAGITGMDPTYSLPGTEDYWKGVFRAGRKVKLSPYKLGKTEVPYKLWKEVYDWAVKAENGYRFANEGQKGSSGSGSEEEPVTTVSWRDCVVWCNAYTQKEKGADECVYRKSDDHTTVLKDATDTAACDAAYADMSKKGFRLPTEAEWEYAARWQNDSTNAEQYGEVWLIKLNSASGAKGNWEDAEKTGEVAWYSGNADSKAHPVGTKKANALGLHDMSGNVWEWCFDRYGNIEAEDVMDPQGAPAASGSGRVLRGGCWRNDAEGCVVGFRISFNPDISYDDLGFRVAMSKN
ncbi:hypothetical protein HMPREF9195_01291 [Treponema medium ATCC 700293]|uniref:BIG2 domain-containing protein n=1 Tax=Treponema medium ATCC 700293 TaxID=1125700 RepID=A0AA87NSU6_TREMD|nr:SUMF1/EgtB/PvdO family nonheme iron enzyme [Treponema medium]EPF28595.1 hypothetical protein HMPREF9195_01291 [Treponema medium ATCC 700293]